ncbi:MAG TPA: dTDP-glucose 4,6-dehydratase [Candidatus Goldiibacteriota bacterium]|nr:dTDP-glucose 4,6-dehydratase [Candidatus Goldiibacteriota bacterium]
MKLLITGGAGFIGSNFTEYILKNRPSYKVTVLDAMTYASNPETIRKFRLSRNFRFIKADIRDFSRVKKAVRGVDFIVNFAAESHVDRSISGPSAFMETNILGCQSMLEAARLSGVKKFIQISTDEVYGSVEKGKSREGDMLDPTSPYSSSKAAADLVAVSYFKTYGFPVIITRSSNNYGPYQHPEKFIPLFITNSIQGEPLPLYGDGRNVRNWIYVEDNCSGIDTALHKGVPGNIYNIGGDTEESNIKIARIIVRETGRKESLIRFVKDRPAHDRRYALDSSKLKKLGWKPKFSFEDGLDLTIDWYRQNQSWWKRLKGGDFKDYYSRHYKKQGRL